MLDVNDDKRCSDEMFPVGKTKFQRVSLQEKFVSLEAKQKI